VVLVVEVVLVPNTLVVLVVVEDEVVVEDDWVHTVMFTVLPLDTWLSTWPGPTVPPAQPASSVKTGTRLSAVMS